MREGSINGPLVAEAAEILGSVSAGTAGGMAAASVPKVPPAGAQVGTAGTEGASQSEVDKYVDYAISKSRFIENPLIVDETVAPLPIGKVTNDLAAKMAAEYGIDISGYTHILTDNDLRHIYNQHGPHTPEAHPVTVEDLKNIPNIINNAEEVYYVPHPDGKKGLYYQYRDNGTTYYLEQIVSGSKTLENKQIIKTSTGTIPDIKGLKTAIENKNRTIPVPSDAAGAVPQLYVQDVKNGASDTTIQQSDGIVKGEPEQEERARNATPLQEGTGTGGL